MPCVRGAFMLPVMEKLLVCGLKISAVARFLPEPSLPPAISTVPSGRATAMAPDLRDDIRPVGAK